MPQNLSWYQNSIIMLTKQHNQIFSFLQLLIGSQLWYNFPKHENRLQLHCWSSGYKSSQWPNYAVINYILQLHRSLQIAVTCKVKWLLITTEYISPYITAWRHQSFSRLKGYFSKAAAAAIHTGNSTSKLSFLSSFVAVRTSGLEAFQACNLAQKYGA